jgi:hypothetical protein
MIKQRTWSHPGEVLPHEEQYSKPCIGCCDVGVQLGRPLNGAIHDFKNKICPALHCYGIVGVFIASASSKICMDIYITWKGRSESRWVCKRSPLSNAPLRYCPILSSAISWLLQGSKRNIRTWIGLEVAHHTDNRSIIERTIWRVSLWIGTQYSKLCWSPLWR